MPNLLVELGTEELPTDALAVVYNHLPAKVTEAFKANRLSFKSLQVEATPRRVAFFVEDLAAKQEDENLELSGPSLEKAYDPSGNPTQALQGFLKSKEADLKDIEVKETPRGKFIVVRKSVKGKAAAAVLDEIIPAIFTSLSFPKNMRWEKSGFKYPRPIRWAVALFDKKVIPFTIGNIKAGNTSYGHRFLAPKAFKILTADWALYKKALAKANVVLELEARKAMIAKELEKRFGQKSWDEELLATTAQLAEEPFLLEGSFKKEYLELPKEVLASCMKKNQKIFALYDSNGKLNGKFAAVMNGARPKAALPRIREDYENVLESRLKDARYFYKQDTEKKLESKLPLLEQVTYLGKLGNMKQKTERLEKLAVEFADFAGHAGYQADLARAAKLSKIDLMTHLVYEFPDIQGIAGREYAAKSGEKKEVAQAIGTQYLPKNLSEDYQDLFKEMNQLGAMLGVVDRMDHLVGAFGLGMQPSGSQDPYALRRAGGALVKIIRAFDLHFSLNAVLDISISLYQNLLTTPADAVKANLEKFFRERVTFELGAKPGTKELEILQAVMQSSFDNIADVYKRYERLVQMYKKEPRVFLRAAKVVERTGNIIKGSKGGVSGQVDPALFEGQQEKDLLQAWNKHSAQVAELLDQKNYEKATHVFGEAFYAPLNDFFKQVMVNVEDTKIRANRQSLLAQINRLYSGRVADLSLLSGLDSL